jgi:acetylornithine deacetylase
MKGGIAAAVVAAERLAASERLAGDVILAFVIDEEWESLGAAALVERYRADGAVLPEQSDLEVIFAHGGFVWYDVISHGKESAGGEPEHGIDGIGLAGPLLTGIVTLDNELATRETPEWGRPNVHASTIRGGQSYPSYPAECVIGVERCLMPGESVAQSRAEMDGLLAAAAASDPRFRAELRTVIAREPVMLSTDDPVVVEMVEAARAVTAAEPVVRSDYGWMDSGILVEAGIPCVVYGPTGAGLHTPDEWVDLASLDTCVHVFERMARSFCR